MTVAASPERSEGPDTPPADPSRATGPLPLLAVCGLGGLALLPLALRMAGHCDEYNLLRHVTDFAQGDYREPGRPGLLFFALLPLLALPGPEATFLGGRVLATAALAASAFTAGRAADRLGPPGSGPLAAAALLLGAGSLAHGLELRTDGFVAPLVLLALGVVLDAPTRVHPHLGAGVLLGVACCISQKSAYPVAALHAAAAAGWLCRPRGERRGSLLPTAKALVALDGVLFAVVVGWYGVMAVVSGDGLGFVRENLSAAAGTAFTPGGELADKLETTWQSAGLSPLAWFGAPAGALLLVRRPASPAVPLPTEALPYRSRVAAAIALPLALLATIGVHRGWFLYYTASFEPYLSVVAGAGLAALAWHGRVGRVLAATAVVVAAGAVTVPRYGKYHRVHNGYQRAIMRTAAELYPAPVSYADGIGLVPGYPMVGFFNTSLNRKWNRQREPRGMVDRWRSAPALFYVYEYASRLKYLTPEEREFVKSHYIPFADNLWLHGAHLDVPAGTPGASAEIDLLADGPHTVVFRDPFRGEVRLDGERVVDRQVVRLTRGSHRLEGRATSPRGGAVQVFHGAGRDPRPDPVDWSGFIPLHRVRYQQYGNTDLKTVPEDGGRARR